MTFPVPSSSVGAPPRTRLNGWKEIAAHFGRGVRTVQRWEKTLGMPVYRIGSGRGENVHAFPPELDAWLASVRYTADLSDRPTAPGDSGIGHGHADNGERVGSTPAPPNAVAPTSADTSTAPTSRRLVVGAVLTSALALAVWFAWSALGQPASEATTPAAANRVTTAQPPSIPRFDVDILRVLDANGKELWTKRFSAPLPEHADKEVPGQGKAVEIADIDGDGQREVLLFAPDERGRNGTTLHCYESSGDERWNTTLSSSVRFGQIDYTPPWSGFGLFVTGAGDRPALWAAWVNVTTGEFPCLLQRLDPRTGKPLAGFGYWSAGFITVVKEAELQGRPSLLVGAANNDRKGASLAVFDRDRVGGSAPAIDSDKRCVSCEAGGPREFIVFPHMELGGPDGTGAVSEVRVSDAGDVSVWIYFGSRHGTFGWLTYFLDGQLRPVRAEIGDGYKVIHEEFEAEGRLKHRFGERDLKQLWPVLVHTGGRFVPVTDRTSR